MSKGLSKRQLRLNYGFNARHLETLLEEGVLLYEPNPTSSLRRKISTSSLQNLVEGKHYVICKECGSYQAQITSKISQILLWFIVRSI